MKERGLSFTEVLKAAVRAGVTNHQPVGAFRSGPSRILNWDKALGAADSFEDEELTRKLSLRK